MSRGPTIRQLIAKVNERLDAVEDAMTNPAKPPEHEVPDFLKPTNEAKPLPKSLDELLNGLGPTPPAPFEKDPQRVIKLESLKTLSTLEARIVDEFDKLVRAGKVGLSVVDVRHL